MEAMLRIAPDKQALAEMKQWLLKQKQEQAWRTPMATADEVNVFFVTGEKQVVTTGSVTAVIGTARLEASGNRLDAVRQSVTGTEPQVPEIRFEKTGGGLSWGAVYAQFFQETSKMNEKKGNGVSVVRTYYLDVKKVTAGTSLKVEQALAEMKQWLLKQKQVQAWRTPIATADAVYVFFVTGEKQVVTTGSVTAVIGTARLEASGNRLDAVRQSFTGTETQVPEIRFEKTGGGLSWGAVYAQFFEETSKLKEKKGNGVSVVRTYYLDGKKVTAGTSLKVGDKLTVRLQVKADRDMDFIQLRDGRAACMQPEEQLSGYRVSDTSLKVGDKLTVRLQVKADRDMDFIQLRDGRAACMQPEEQLSGYRVSDGISYYQVSRDASTDFFMDKLRKGQYTIEYKVYIDRSGVYQAGAATIQSAYAPEFGGHSDGGTLTVE